MSGSDRGKQSAAGLIGTIFVAIIGVGLYWSMFYSAGYGSGYNERKAQIEAGHYASDTPKQIDRECGTKTGKATRECIAEIIKTERESQRGESDLAAQWKAADWVLWAGVIAGAQLIATLAGLYYVKRTLDATLEAVEDTGKATNAMLRQTELVEREQRPWVVIEAGTPKIIRKGFVTFIFVDVVFKNIGKTVAAGFWPHINSFVSGKEYKDKAEAAFKQWRQPKGSVDRILMPGESWPSTQVFRLREQDLPWFDGTNERMIHAVLQAAAFYFPDGDRTFDARLHTERTFRIGILDSDDPLLAYVLTQEAIGHPYNFEFVTTSCGPRSAK